MTADESSTYSSLMADINTYVSTAILQMIVGDLDIDSNWDSYVAAVNSMGIDEALACKKAAYERYQGRQ
jgi:putative aldouronate transport system substrate-binding protein